MVGDEAGYPAGQFAARLRGRRRRAASAARSTPASTPGADSVRAALALPVTRIDHGVRAIEDPELVGELAARGIVLNVCPTSNVALGVFDGYDAHPLRALRDAGVRVTLGSDDPPYFGASIGGEYAVAAERFGLDDDALTGLTRTAIEASLRGGRGQDSAARPPVQRRAEPSG